MNAETFVARLEEVFTHEAGPDGLDLIFNTVDDHLLAGHFDEVNAILLTVATGAVTRLPMSSLLSFLTVVPAWERRTQTARAALFDAAYARARREGGTESAERLFRGLAPLPAPN